MPEPEKMTCVSSVGSYVAPKIMTLAARLLHMQPDMQLWCVGYNETQELAHEQVERCIIGSPQGSSGLVGMHSAYYPAIQGEGQRSACP